VEVNIYRHLQALSKDIFIRTAYAFIALETIFCLMCYTSVLSYSRIYKLIYNSTINTDERDTQQTDYTEIYAYTRTLH